MFDSSGVINILGKDSRSIGTGFFVSSDGYILTCTHILVKEGYKINDTINCWSEKNKSFKARWDETSTINSDIAVLKSSFPQQNDFYILISSIGFIGQVESFGFPNGKKNGIYARAEVYETVKSFKGNILTQLGNANDITYGFSGAPIVTSTGNVVGMISDIPKSDKSNRLANIAFAIPTSIILNCFTSLFINTPTINVDNDNPHFDLEFVGRRNEINRYTQLIDNNNVIVIHGMAGVGKTTLASHLFNGISSPKVWLTIRSGVNNEAETVIHDISEYLSRLGKNKPINMFYDLGNNSQTYGIAFHNLQQEIIQCVLDLKLAIFIDDAHLINNDKEMAEFFTALISKCINNRVVFISRHVLDFIANNGKPLKGLTKNDSNELLVKSGISLSNSQLERLYQKTQGNVKFLELCIFSLQDHDKKTIDDFINDMSVDFNLNSYIQSNITDSFSELETRILNIIALCRKPINLELISKICSEYDFENIYFSLDRFIRRNIVDIVNDAFYSMHALLKDYFSRLSSQEILLLHRKIAENLNFDEAMEISYHYALCGRLSKAISILIDNFDNLISKGFTSLLLKQLLSYNQLKQHEDEIQYNLLLGKLQVARGQYDKAISILKETRPVEGVHIVFECFILLSQCYEKKGMYLESINALREAEKCVNSRESASMAVININKGFLLCHQEQIINGIRLCEKGLQVIEHCSDINQNLLAEGYSNLGWNYTISGDYTKAESALYKSKELYNSNLRGVSLLNIRLARIKWQKGYLKDALSFINEAEKMADLTGDPQLQAFSLRQKSLILWNMGEFEKALCDHKESLRKYSKINDYWGIAASLENVAAVLFDMNQNEKAMKYVNNAINICKKITATDFLAYAFIFKSRILTNQGDIPRSISYAKKSLRLLKKWKYSNYYYGMALIALGIAYMSNENYIKARIVLYFAEKKLFNGSALFQKHIATFYKGCLKQNQSLIEDCYEYFNAIGAKKIVEYLCNIEFKLREDSL